ncbi:hypothetical protein MicvaDRAFT_0341 [Microcoleus vaginatus FGP-2]|nr:hypothetical protein MicvaDRAFT_0341 [Microcoleus vaginatus FGP-2]
MQGQDVLTCPTITNNHQKTSIGEVFLFEMMRDRARIKLVTSDLLHHFDEQAFRPVPQRVNFLVGHCS